MKKIILSLAILAISLLSYAVPAKPGPKVITQKDGSEITVFAHGDEFHNYLTDKEGNLLLKNAEGIYVKANAEQIAKHKAQAKQADNQRKVRQSAQFVNLAPRGLVILANFKDKQFQYTQQDFNDMLNKTGFNRDGAIGCVREYFYNQSYGKYQPTFDVVGPVDLKNNSTSYAGPGGTSYSHLMIQQACQLADKQFDVDFTRYDNDGDGEVDFVFVFYAGYGQADYGDEDCVWPHMWWLDDRKHGGYSDNSVTLDGKKVNMYACTNELTLLGAKYNEYSGQYTGGKVSMAGQSTFCHEFSHVCGLPDFYDTRDTDNPYSTLGQWDVMDMGPYNNDGITPPAYSAYERFYCGWIEPTLLPAEGGCFELPNLNNDGQAFMITSTGEHNMNGEVPSPTTFYLLENRQQGYKTYDQYLPGSGMLITKVRYKASDWENNSPNSYKRGNQGVELIEADNARSDYGDAGDPYPGTSKVTSKLVITGYQLSNITEKNQVIFFNLNSTESCNSYTAPQKAKWSDFVDGIEDVILDPQTDEKVLGIYTIMGTSLGTTDVSKLQRGLYIIHTNKGAKKINIQ